MDSDRRVGEPLLGTDDQTRSGYPVQWSQRGDRRPFDAETVSASKRGVPPLSTTHVVVRGWPRRIVGRDGQHRTTLTIRVSEPLPARRSSAPQRHGRERVGTGHASVRRNRMFGRAQHRVRQR